MRKLRLVALAATAAASPVAMAQTVPDPDPFYGIPRISLSIPTAAAAPAAVQPPQQVRVAVPAPRAGTSWEGRASPPVQVAQAAPQTVYVRRMPSTPPMAAPMATAQQVERVDRLIRRDGPPPPAIVEPVVRRMVRADAPPPPPSQMDGRHYRGPAPMDGRHYQGPGRDGRDGRDGRGGMHRWQRIGRGGMLPPMWWGPQFQVGNWGMYGFPAPMPGARWVRYYDDALMVGRDGRVLDGRYGYDWDRYGDRWGYNDDGVPVYVGHGDYEPRGDDYADDEGYDGYDRGGPPRGYGAYMGAPVLVSETIVTEGPVVETRTWTETVTERVRVTSPRHRRAVRRCSCKLQRLYSGERG